MGKQKYLAVILSMCLGIVLMNGCASNHYTWEEDNQVIFYLKSPEAREVFFVSSIDHFQYNKASLNREGEWIYTTQGISEFSYFYVVDGVVTVPDCKSTVLDDFGAKNCIFSPET